MSTEQDRLGIFLTQDLIFSIKVVETARAMRLRVIVVEDIDQAEEVCREHQPGCLLVDLAMPGLETEEAIRRLRSAAGTRASVIAFGPHVQRHLLEAAAAAGCDEVYPRSKFSSHLPSLLRRHLASESQSEPESRLEGEQPRVGL